MKEKIKNILKALYDLMWLNGIYFVYFAISIFFIILLVKGIQVLINIGNTISEISIFYTAIGFLIPFFLIIVIPISFFLFKKWRKTRKKEGKETILTEKKKIRIPTIRIGNGLVRFFIFLIFLAIVLIGWYRSEKIYEHYQQQRYQKSMHTMQR